MSLMRSVELPAGVVEYAESGSGRPVVLLHGLVLNGRFWRNVVPLLEDRYRCIVPTLPLGGHARPMRSDADLSPVGIAALIADFLEALDLEDAVLVSNDTATAFTQLLVTQQPERVGALVLTSGDAFRHFLPWQVRHLQWLARVPGAAPTLARALQLPWVRRSWLGFAPLTLKGVPDEVSAAYVRPLAADAGVRRDLVKVLTSISTRYTLEAARWLPAFPRPVLIAWAGRDVLFPRRDAERLAATFRNARLEVVEDSRTYLPEDQPERLAALIHEFLGTPVPHSTGS